MLGSPMACKWNAPLHLCEDTLDGTADGQLSVRVDTKQSVENAGMLAGCTVALQE